MGDKVQARRVMQEAGLPVVPGTEELTSESGAAEEAIGIGYPILIKATAGGGGKGIRTVYKPEELPMAMEAASQEAASAFGHGAVYLEKFLEPVRHVEVQIISDGRGNVVALGERECSIQRRHQKMIEEAPSTAIAPPLRKRLLEMAITAARAGRLHQRRHPGIPHRPAGRSELPGNEYAAPGRAPRDGAGHRRRPSGRPDPGKC